MSLDGITAKVLYDGIVDLAKAKITKYAHIDENNKLIGWFTTDVHDVIPEPNIPVTDAIWQEALNINANYYDGTKFIAKDFRTDVELEEARVASIKTKAGQIITSKYDIIKQMNIYGEGGDKQVEMFNWIKKIRDISNLAEKNKTALADINWEI